MSVHIGTSGWSYDHWQGLLYPDRTPGAKRLAYYIQRYKTVEVNNTYYRWPRDETFASWREQVPPEFLVTIKAPRGLSHIKRLKEPEAWLERVEGGLKQLHEKIGVFLVQLPPQFARNDERLAYFLQRLPSWFKTSIEFRHPTWHCEEVFAMLENAGVAYCVMSGANLPCVLRATAPFVYVRFHGPDPEHLYAGSYSDVDMRWWAERIREWQADGREVFAYFNNDPYGHALRNADTLKHLSGL